MSNRSPLIIYLSVGSISNKHKANVLNEPPETQFTVHLPSSYMYLYVFKLLNASTLVIYLYVFKLLNASTLVIYPSHISTRQPNALESNLKQIAGFRAIFTCKHLYAFERR